MNIGDRYKTYDGFIVTIREITLNPAFGAVYLADSCRGTVSFDSRGKHIYDNRGWDIKERLNNVFTFDESRRKHKSAVTRLTENRDIDKEKRCKERAAKERKLNNDRIIRSYNLKAK